MESLAYQSELGNFGISLHGRIIDALISEIENAIADGRIRSQDGKHSVFDFIREILKRKNERSTWAGLLKKDPIIASKCSIFQFEGAGQRETTVADINVLIEIASLLRYDRQKTASSKKVVGSIYVLKDAGNNALKVGFSTDVEKRIKNHKTSHPFLELVYTFPVLSICVEQSLHQLLRKHLIKGTVEWYRLSPDIMPLIIAFANINSRTDLENNF